MGQAISSENLENGPSKFSRNLGSGMSPEERKTRYEKEIARLLENWPEGGQDKYRAEFKGIDKVEILDNFDYNEVSFDQHMLVYQVHKDGQNHRTYKKVIRSKADVWRRFGAVKKLHEIGGKGSNTGVGTKAKYYDIRPGSTPPPDPPAKPLFTIDDYKPFGGISGNSTE